MQIIQNVACLEVTLNPSDKRINISSDILRGKKINAIYAFSSTQDVIMASPNGNDAIAQISETQIELFLNLTDNKGHNFIKDYSLKNFVLTSEPYAFLETPINRLIDFDKSYINYIGNAPVSMNILILVFYQTQNYTRISDEIMGSITIEIPDMAINAEMQLSTIINQTLKNKRIKQIICSDHCYGYLNLMCANHTIDNIPTTALQINSPKRFYFDALDIDFEKSYYRQAGNYSEKNTITFIY